MDIWIIQDGEKIGPIHDFEVRRKIENGELSSTTPAWHEGIDAWKPLVEIDLFSREFDKPPEPAEPESKPTAPPVSAASPDQAHLIRRFWARWLDLTLFAGIWWLAIWASGRDIETIFNQPWIILFHYIPWFAIEAFLLHRFGTTAGKSLLGIRVVNDDGSYLSLTAATIRSARVFIMGVGFGWLPLALICQIFAWFTTKRLGRPLWDHTGGHRLIVTPLESMKIVTYVLVFFTSIVLQMIVLFPYVVEKTAERNPEFRKQWEQFQDDMRQAKKPK